MEVVSDVAERFRKIAAEFSARAEAVSDDGWDNQSPCEDWRARDIVRHLVAWMPSYCFGDRAPEIPDVDQDPLASWTKLRDAIQSALDGSDDAKLERAVAAYVIGDILIHTWDLARATGQDETLDADEVRRALTALTRPDETVLSNGHFSASVDVPETADEQTKLLALTGRQP